MGTSIRKVVSRQGDSAQGRFRRDARERPAAPPRVVEGAQVRQYGVIYQKQAGRSEGFIVSIRRRGRTLTRRFASSKYGGLPAALEAAIAWRDACLAETPVFTLREFHARVRSNNTSGVPGVTFLRPSKQPEGLWQAKISPGDGRRLCRQFSVRKFGPAEAFARAVAARSEFLASIPEKAYVVDPIAKCLSAMATGTTECRAHSRIGAVDKRRPPRPLTRRGSPSSTCSSYVDPRRKRVARKK